MADVVVIDDEPFVCYALRRVLSRAAYEVVLAANAEEGLAVLAQAPARVVIIDIIMPGMNGVEAIALIRQRHPDVRIVAISGGGNFGIEAYQPEAISTQAYLAAAAKAGADTVLAKPFETEQILTAVRELLEATQPALGSAGPAG